MRDTKYKDYLQPAFLICATVLALAGSGMSIAIKSLGVHLQKSPLPLRKPLSLLGDADLGPFRVIADERIENEQIIKELGTEEYVQLILEDEQAPDESPVRRCSLFITYYAVVDVVPHVPEECYMGVGFQRLSSESVTLSVSKNGRRHQLNGRCAVFSSTSAGRWHSDAKFPVLYFFKVNGVYAGSREDTRLVLNKNLFGKFAYYCKVEWKFFNTSFGQLICPKKQEAVRASEKLLSLILPVLETDHWPEWNAAEGK
ncbi:MAG: hypothetical protein ACYTEL_06125 [Planctomycetota bacterium]|jgi:hypothetical protein